MTFMDPQGLMEASRCYNRIIAEVARETGALLVKGEAMIPADGERFNDTVHFKHAGSRIMARRVSEALLADPAFRALAAARRKEK
jgi:hypothetical protein